MRGKEGGVGEPKIDVEDGEPDDWEAPFDGGDVEFEGVFAAEENDEGEPGPEGDGRDECDKEEVSAIENERREEEQKGVEENGDGEGAAEFGRHFSEDPECELPRHSLSM